MTVQAETLHTDLAGIVGAEHIRSATPADAIDGVQSQLVIEPGSADEVAHVLRFANDAGLRIAPRGGGTKLSWGNPPRGADLILSMLRLNQVLEHAWGDMTATVQAGCTVAEFGRALAEHGQRLALDPLWPERATIGGILATNDSGALRVRFGTLRDLIIGMTVALPDGTLARSGGKVVKNVAGYDLPKLMTGALGTLGVIVEATFRLYPLPVATTIVSYRVASVQAANEFVLKILDSTLVPTGVQLTIDDAQVSRINVRFEGIADAIKAQTEQLERIGAMIPGAAPASPAIVDYGMLWYDAMRSIICKVSVTPSQLQEVAQAVERLAHALRLQWAYVAQGVGVGLLRFDGANDQALLTALTILRGEIASLGGSLVVLHAPPDVKNRSDVWGATGDALPLMRRVKERFDPNGILNSGRFVGGI